MDKETNVQLPVETGNAPLGAVSPVQEAGNTTQPPVWTKEDIAEIVKAETSKAFQGIQSMQAKTEERIRKEVNNRLETLVQAGIQLAPEQQQMIAQRTREQLVNDYASTGEPQPPAPEANGHQNVPPQQPDNVGVINQMAQGILQKAGVTIDPADPEVAMINQTTMDAMEFLDSMRAAAAAKKERLARQPTPAAVPGSIGAGAAPTGLQAQYEKEKLNISRGDVDQLFRLQLKYRQKGLQV